MEFADIAAGKVVSTSAVFLMMTIVLLAVARRISTSILVFGLQSAIITAQVAGTAYLERSAEAWVVAGLIFVFKVLGIPYAFFWLTEKLKSRRDVQAATTPAQSVFIVVIMIFVSYAAVRSYAFGIRVPEDALAAAVALILTGAFLMVSRRKALMQMLGLLVLENGIFLAALTTTFGMPLIIEMGILFDVLIGLLLMGIFAFRIRDTFEHLDVSRLRRLRG
jgi:hydrogenase-4 component E